MKEENNIQKTAAKIAENINSKINKNINDVKMRMAREQAECEFKSKGSSLDEIKNELQCILYSKRTGKFLISFCEYIMFALACLEITLFIGRTSTDYRIVNACFEAGIIEIFIAAIIGIICFIKNKHVPILIYTIPATVTYFLRLTEHSYYNMLNFGVLVLMLIMDICIVRTFINSNETTGIKEALRNLFKSNREYEDRTQADMMRCPKCGHICTGGSNFCGQCGEKLNFKGNSYFNNNDDIKSEDNKASAEYKNEDKDKFRKSSGREGDTVIIDKTEIIDKTVVMDDIEEKILRHTYDD